MAYLQATLAKKRREQEKTSPLGHTLFITSDLSPNVVCVERFEDFSILVTDVKPNGSVTFTVMRETKVRNRVYCKLLTEYSYWPYWDQYDRARAAYREFKNVHPAKFPAEPLDA